MMAGAARRGAAALRGEGEGDVVGGVFVVDFGVGVVVILVGADAVEGEGVGGLEEEEGLAREGVGGEVGVADPAVVAAGVVAACEYRLEVDHHVGRVGQQRHPDVRQAVRQTDRINHSLVIPAGPADAHVIVDQAAALAELGLGDGGGVNAAAEQVDLDEVNGAVQHLTLLAQVWRPAMTAVEHDRVSRGAKAAAAMGIGALTGLIGIGGGFLFVPALVLLVHVPMHAAVGTSLVLIAMNAASALAAYWGAVSLPWGFVLGFAGVASLGSVLGARTARYLPASVLRRAFGALLLGIAAFVLVDVLL